MDSYAPERIPVFGPILENCITGKTQLALYIVQWQNEGGAGKGGRPRAQGKKGVQNELTGMYFDIFWVKWFTRGAKLGFSGNFVSICGKGVPNCDV